MDITLKTVVITFLVGMVLFVGFFVTRTIKQYRQHKKDKLKKEVVTYEDRGYVTA
ncbi:MAG: hypothetical protein AAF944_04615 [Bacteroidota bacterium]